MRFITATLVAGAILASVSFAQESTARLNGTVTDPTGAVIPHASVAVKNLATSLEWKAQSNESGDYSIPLLPIGQYTVTGEAAGFKTSTITGLTLQVNQE